MQLQFTVCVPKPVLVWFSFAAFYLEVFKEILLFAKYNSTLLTACSVQYY